MLLAIDFFHKKQIIHRDLKLENILINKISEGEYDVKVADLGLSMKLPKGTAKLDEICGTPSYIAPEVLKKVGYREKADIFSLGSIFFNLLTGRYLFTGESTKEILAANKLCDIRGCRKYLEGTSLLARDLLFQMLCTNPKFRISAENALKHQWFKRDKVIINDLLSLNKYVASMAERKNTTFSTGAHIGTKNNMNNLLSLRSGLTGPNSEEIKKNTQ